MSGAKDNPIAAQLMWEYRLKHRDRLRGWTPEDVDTRMLALLVVDRRKMLDLRTKLSNELTAALKGHFPQALALIGNALTRRVRSPLFPVLPRSPNAVDNTSGSIGAWPVPSFSGKPCMNLSICPATNRLGRTRIMKRSATCPGKIPSCRFKGVGL